MSTNNHPFTPAEVKALEKALNIIAGKALAQTFTIGTLSGNGRYVNYQPNDAYYDSSYVPKEALPSFEEVLNKVFAPPPPKPLTADEVLEKVKTLHPEIDIEALKKRD